VLTAVLSLPAPITCEAFADACADARGVGLGGFIRFPSGQRCFFQASLSPAQLALVVPWFPESAPPQSFIAAWELLAQTALVWAAAGLLPFGHPPLQLLLRCDNSAAEAASWKGLSLANGLSHVLLAFFQWQHFLNVFAHIEHVPGFRNQTADGLGRSVSPRSLGFTDTDRVIPPWTDLLAGPVVRSCPPQLDLSQFAAALAARPMILLGGSPAAASSVDHPLWS
jgi:hypothetical protein